jgi:hypothetical protein
VTLEGTRYERSRWLAEGGLLTSPANTPPRYRGELLRLMAIFVDSELSGAAGFADTINAAPGIKQRIAAARIVLENTDHANRILEIMESFGADAARYASIIPGRRASRATPTSARPATGDMRPLPVARLDRRSRHERAHGQGCHHTARGVSPIGGHGPP